MTFANDSWQSKGACLSSDPDLFFPEMENHRGDWKMQSVRSGKVRAAKAICAGCRVRQDCLDFALSNGERFGIWGGEYMPTLKRKHYRREGWKVITDVGIQEAGTSQEAKEAEGSAA